MELYDLLLANKINGGGGGGSSVTVEPLSVTSNGTYSETGKAYSPVNVSVPTPSGSTNISANGTYDVTDFASASVAVPNSYTTSDEGKVVSSGALVAQTSQTIDTNGTYDTTLKDEIVVNVSGGGGGDVEIEEGTFTPSSDVTSASVPFSKTHDTLPSIVLVWANTASLISDASNFGYQYINHAHIFGNAMRRSSSGANTIVYGYYEIKCRNGGTSFVGGSDGMITQQESAQGTTFEYPRCWATESSINFPLTASTNYWRAAYTYKWIAIWAPTE